MNIFSNFCCVPRLWQFAMTFQDFKVDTFEYRILREVEFRESLTRRYAGESDAQLSQTVDRTLGPVAPPQISQKPRNSKLAEGADATFQAKVSANPRPRVSFLSSSDNYSNIINTIFKLGIF